MKKLISTIAALTLTSSAALPLIACSPDNSLKIAFVPSKDPIAVINKVKPLEKLLRDRIKKLDPEFNRNVNITTTTNYQAAGQALQDGKVALAFLPVGTYSDYRGAKIADGNYADAAPLVIAQRNAMRPDTNQRVSKDRNITLEQQMAVIKDYNNIAKGGIKDHDDAYQKLYHQTSDKEPTAFYRAEIIANNSFLSSAGIDINHLFDNKVDYQTQIKKLIEDKNTIIQLLSSNSSGAGVIYPVKWMLDNGIDRNKISGILRTQSRAKSYTDAAQSVANNATNITVGYTDIRADAENVNKDYQNTTMIGLTSGIPNDGISYSKKAIKDFKLLSAIRQAFKQLINDKDSNIAGIFDVYSHTDYVVPDKNATPDQALAWEISENAKYDEATKEIQAAIDLIKQST